MKYKLYIFDLDGTLVEPFGTEPLPGVREWFDTRYGGERLAIATNQGGVGLRYWMETHNFGNPDKYPTEQDVVDRLDTVCNLLPPLKSASIFVSYAYVSKKGNWSPAASKSKSWSREYRKPSPYMLLDAMRENFCTHKETLMVGDWEEDELASIAAGCGFAWAKDFFG